MTSGARRKSDVSLIVGPSHAIRWQWHVRDGVVPSPLPANRIIGDGGAPIWSKRLFEMVRNSTKEDERVGVMVGDFRFGNAIALQGEDAQSPLFQDGYLRIDTRAMTPECDAKMLARGKAGVAAWFETFGHRARFLFWDLFARQVQDRMAGRYIGPDGYNHPSFNYADVVADFPDAEIADLSPLLSMAMHEVTRLFIDSSSHPSQIGYLFLTAMLCESLDARAAYTRAVSEFETELFTLARAAAAANGGKVLITGRSIWLDTFARHLGATGASRLAAQGVILAPLDRLPAQPSIADLMQNVVLENCRAVVVSCEGADLSPLLAAAFGTDAEAWRDVPHLDWESSTAGPITGRKETPRFAYDQSGRPRARHVIDLQLAPHMVEQGAVGQPSWTGLKHPLEELAKGRVVAAALGGASEQPSPDAEVSQIEGDALLTDKGVAFLIGANQALLKATTGDLRPSPQSLAHFRENIVSRMATSGNFGARYAHVIFPEKQSVMMTAFPYHPVHRPGDAYLACLEPAQRDWVLYPADRLRLEAETPFYPLDTHLSDIGSLAALRMMLDKVGLTATSALDRLAARIVRPVHGSGDLGRTFTPRLFQDGFCLEPDWPVTMLRSPGGFNEGMVDILFNAEAEHDLTLLLFGDSFFHRMLRHFSAVFTRVICLRTRYLHKEMVALIEPDVVFTGNAERHLLNVASDRDAQAFTLYPEIKDAASPREDKTFLRAWQAVTAPHSDIARAVFDGHGLTRRARRQEVPAPAL